MLGRPVVPGLGMGMEGMKLVGDWWPMSRMGVVDVVGAVGVVVSFVPRTWPVVVVGVELGPVPFMRVLSWKLESVRMEVICAS